MANMYPSKLASGGNPTETTLWTNPSPGSQFATQTVTLSDSLLNYDYVKFVFRQHTSTTAETIILVSVTDFQNYLQYKYSPAVFCCSTTPMSVRGVYYVSDTTVGFYANARVGSSGSANASNIPYKIIGVKY